MITLKTLHEATAQQVYDQVKAHLLSQNAKSEIFTPTWACAYRGNNGFKCSAGCLIADDEYSSRMEQQSWAALVAENLVPATQEELIRNLQSIHDNYSPVVWKKRLEDLALYLNLTP